MLLMCSAGARRCRAQCDVLVIPQLVTIVSHIFYRIFVLVLLVVVVVVLACSCPYFRMFDLQNRQIGCAFAYFESFRGENAVNTNVFRSLETQNHGIYDVFCFR